MIMPLTRALTGALVVLALAVSACGPASSSEPPATASSEPTVASASADASSPAAPGEPSPGAGDGLSSDPLHAVVLRDVRTGEEFRIGQLAAAKPLLLEPMAIWCSNCRGQQREVVGAHALADFESVSLDIDTSELPGDLADYAVQEGFDWRFAMADGELISSLRARFGSGAIFPTAMPKILFRTDGSVELIGLGEQLSAQELAAVIAG